jgi:hypothetical protein
MVADELNGTVNLSEEDSVVWNETQSIVSPNSGSPVKVRLHGTNQGVNTRSFNRDLNFGLSGFYFDFLEEDHHIKNIRALIFKRYDYLNGVSVEYSDQNNDDHYYWAILGQEILGLEWTKSYTSQACGCEIDGPVGKYTYERYPSQIPVLLGFRFMFKGSDHHLEIINVDVYWKWDGTRNSLYMRAHFADNNQDDTYFAQIQCGLVNAENVASQGQISGKSKGSVSRYISATNPMLQGFRLRFRNGDHHLDTTGVWLTKKRAKIDFSDKDTDDEFEYRVRWVDSVR